MASCTVLRALTGEVGFSVVGRGRELLQIVSGGLTDLGESEQAARFAQTAWNIVLRSARQIRHDCLNCRQSIIPGTPGEVSRCAIAMAYAKEFFDLQLQFARKVAVLAAIPLEEALLGYTNLYVRFVGDLEFNRDDPIWSAYLGGVKEKIDLGDWTYHFYCQRPHRVRPESVLATFGCFSYALGESGQIRLHFHNVDRSLHGPLSDERLPSRISDLASLVSHIRSQRGSVKHIAGVSWLYNLDSYRRLFPESYVAAATVATNRFRNMPLWGQFLNRHGDVRKDAATLFVRQVCDRTSLADLARCFPLQPLAVSARVEAFHDFYTSKLAAKG